MVDRERITLVLRGVMRFALAAGLALAPGALRAQIYRCNVDGRVVYTDKACATKGAEVSVAPPVTSTTPGVAAPALSLQQSAGLGRVLVGMTPRQVELAWGAPHGRTSEQDSKSITERWSYAREGDDVRVQFEGGVVARITRTRSPPTPPPAPDPLQSLTVSEIEERERAAKAGERRFLREGMTQEDVRGRLGPPLERRIKQFGWGTAECWMWPPTPRDVQTRTTACFSAADQRLMSFERRVEH
jgi:hypothetical protein